MENKKAIRKYRLPQREAAENMSCGWSHVLTYGNKLLLAGHYYTGPRKPCFFGAVYQYEGDDARPDGYVSLIRASEVEFYDAGHAIKWCIDNID